MSRTDPEDLLWQLPPSEDVAGLPAPERDELVAFRAGQLSEVEEAALAARLARSRAGRERLRNLAGTAGEPVPSPALRARMLTSLAPEPEAAAARWRGRAAALAASVLLAMVVAGSWWLNSPRPPSPLPRYEVAVLGLRDVRSATQAPRGTARAFADTPVRLSAVTSEPPTPGLVLAVYRAVDGQLVRLARAEPAERRQQFELVAPAAWWTGGASGPHTLYLVIARSSEAPERLPLGAGSPSAALAAGGVRQVHEVVLELVPPS